MKSYTILLWAAAYAAAATYPPAQGPPTPPASDAPKTLPIRALVDAQLRDAVDQKLQVINAKLAARGDVHAVVSPVSFTTFQPFMTQTQFVDKPNSRYLLIRYMVGLNASQVEFHTALGWISYPWDRNIEVSIEIGIFCDHWETGNGAIVVHPKSARPYLDADPSFSEQIVNAVLGDWLVPYVDSQVRQGLSDISVAPVATTIGCNYMDYVVGNESDLNDGYLTYEQKKTLSMAQPPITVNLVELTRLVAHDANGSPVYSATETPVLSLYANFAGAFKALAPMTEGQTISLASMRAVSVPPPGYGGSLILIVSLTQSEDADEEGSNFLVFPVTPNFAGGRQKIRIPKTYSYLPSFPPRSKPVIAVVDGYEITVDISIPSFEVRR